MTDNTGRYCDRCGVKLTKKNNKCGHEVCDPCNEILYHKFLREMFSEIEEKREIEKVRCKE